MKKFSSNFMNEVFTDDLNVVSIVDLYVVSIDDLKGMFINDLEGFRPEQGAYRLELFFRIWFHK